MNEAFGSGISPIDRLFRPLMEEKVPPGLGFAHGALDRAAHLRAKPEAIEVLRQAAASRFYAFCGDNAVLLREGANARLQLALSEIPVPEQQQEWLFLGLEGEAARFAVLIASEAEANLQMDSSLLLAGVRALALDSRNAPADLGAVAAGKAMLHWHARHRFCAHCGAATQAAESGWKRVCAACSTEHFPRTDPVVIMLVMDGDDCLLGRSARFPPGWYSTLAGFVEPGETIEEAVRRETFEEAGIRSGRVTIMANQPWPFPMSLMIGAFVQAKSRAITIDYQELEDCRWFSRDEVRRMLAGTHAQGFGVPAQMSIASHLIRHFAAG